MIQTTGSPMRWWLAHLAAVTGGVIAPGCTPTETGEPAQRTHAVRIDTVRGIVHVRNSGEVRPWKLRRLVELGRVGEVGAVDPEELARINSSTLDRDGRVFVTDAYALEIRVSDTLGDSKDVRDLEAV